VNRQRIWAGWIITILMALLLLMDSSMKILQVPAILEQAAKNGFSAGEMFAVGIVLLVCLVLYLIPRTSVLGAVLLTGYLGGAAEANFHAHMGAGLIAFPVIVGVFVWAGLWPREPRLAALLPWRR